MNAQTMQVITIEQLSAALLCTDRNVRDREGKSLPQPLNGIRPRSYDLSAVLWIVNGIEREQICKAMDLDTVQLRSRLAADTRTQTGYVPGVDDE